MRKITGLVVFCICLSLGAQTETDALFMAKRNLCGGFIYGNSSWNKYWEGTFYRDNANLGTFKSQSVMAMANYGISNTFNIIASAAWVQNRVTAGTLIGQKGIQDLNVYLKKELLAKDIKGFNTSLVAVGGVSAPMSNYVADYLPLSIGMRSKTAEGFGRCAKRSLVCYCFGCIYGSRNREHRPQRLLHHRNDLQQ